MSMDSFSDFVRKRLRELGLSQGDLADRAKLSRQAVVKLLSGETKDPKISTVRVMAFALNVSPIHLFRLLIGRNLIEIGTRAAAHVPGDHSSFVTDATVPNGTVVGQGTRFEKVWDIQNTGRVNWIGRRLRCETIPGAGDEANSTKNFLLPDQREILVPTTSPGGVARLRVWFTAPTLPCSCISNWKMIDAEGRQCFPSLSGLTCAVFVTAS
jgi:transcriptional regulator with XRE-family HTH domain